MPETDTVTVVVERWKVIIATILLLLSLASSVGTYKVNEYRIDRMEDALIFFEDDYVPKETLQLKLDNIIIKLDNLGDKLDEHNRTGHGLK